MALAVLLKIVLWILYNLVLICFVPITYCKSLKRREKCPPIENKILLLSATEIAKRIREKQTTCKEVIEAYIARIKEVNPIINAVIEDRFEEALKEAEEKDTFIKNTHLSEEEIKQKFPLFGVPITIKGSIAIKGLNCGSGRLDYTVKAKEDAVTVRYIKQAGAVPLLNSNIPEFCMNWETYNKLIKTTNNPYDTRRTPGGSSGVVFPKASLLGCGASVIGIGSDIAGSLRLPAHNCGIWGHKPSPRVVSTKGHYPDCKNEEIWTQVFTLGPLARYVSDLKLLLNVIMEPEKRNLLQLDKQVKVEKIKFYYMNDPRAFGASRFGKDVVSAIKQVIDHFNVNCDCKCTQVNLPLMKYCPELSAVYMLCQIQGVDRAYDGNAYLEALKFLIGRSNHSFTTILYEILSGVAPIVFGPYLKTVNKAVDNLRNDFLKMLGDDGVFIFPTCPVEATFHYEFLKQVSNATYLSIFNVLGFPVTNCPIKFSENGIPLGVQIIAAPNLDRLTLTVAEEIERAFGGWKLE